MSFPKEGLSTPINNGEKTWVAAVRIKARVGEFLRGDFSLLTISENRGIFCLIGEDPEELKSFFGKYSREKIVVETRLEMIRKHLDSFIDEFYGDNYWIKNC